MEIERTPYNYSKEQNWHENLEIQLCTAGEGTVLLDGRSYAIGKGDIVVVNSDVVHYTSTSDYLRYTCIIISTAWCKQMKIDYDALCFEPLIKSPMLEGFMARLMRLYSDEGDSLRVAKLNDILLRIMLELAREHSAMVPSAALRGRNYDIVKKTVIYLQQNFDRRVSLEEISEAVFLDKFLLCKEFKRYTGQTIVEYLNRYRCMRAIEYLSDGETVAEAAFLCGFENLSFFAKIFKRYTKHTPSHYKK